jgi:16S rRNA G966 N2-methylase RsmD
MSTLVAQVEPILSRITAERQSAKRHYGIHPYFTRRPANVVRAYIKRFTQPGEYVLDPFGGSGVTAVEAMLLNRHGIHNDLNPFANFIASGIADTTHDDTQYIREAFSEVESRAREPLQGIPQLRELEIQETLAKVSLPENIKLPRNSDADTYYAMFSPRQLLALALLKEAVDHVRDPSARGALLLAWSATLGELNKTFLSAKGRLKSRGGSSIFSIYRYKLAANPVELPPWEVFRDRVLNVIEGKREVLRQRRLWARTEGWQGNFQCYCLDIADLPKALGRQVDYIFTDPPYGGHIAYLDLSVLWNHWLGLEVPLSLREREIIVGGELRLSEEHYISRLRESIRLCIDMLKAGRWLSVVFQHWNTRYFEAILEEAASSGATLRAAVTQVGDTIWSMHKKKNMEKVLAGEMILSFVKDGKGLRPKSAAATKLTVSELIDEALSRIAADARSFPGELLFNDIVLRAWQSGALHSLDLTREDFSDLLRKKGWRYDVARHRWSCANGHPSHDGQLAF